MLYKNDFCLFKPVNAIKLATVGHLCERAKIATK
jgi:hypothetical protein